MVCMHFVALKQLIRSHYSTSTSNVQVNFVLIRGEELLSKYFPKYVELFKVKLYHPQLPTFSTRHFLHSLKIK